MMTRRIKPKRNLQCFFFVQRVTISYSICYIAYLSNKFHTQAHHLTHVCSVTDLKTKKKGKEQREKEARQRWCEDLGKLKGRVYASVARVLEEKMAEWKRFDSNTYTDRVHENGSVRGDRGQGDVQLLAGWLGGTSL